MAPVCRPLATLRPLPWRRVVTGFVLPTLLSDAFAFGAEAPTAIGQWQQPSHDLDANDQKGKFWRLHFSGVDQVSAVPEPASALLLALGGLALWPSRSRRSAHGRG